MAIDTRNKRAAVIGFDGPYRSVFPNPDGSLSNQSDRQHMAWKYPGILAGGAGAAFLRRNRYGRRTTISDAVLSLWRRS